VIYYIAYVDGVTEEIDALDDIVAEGVLVLRGEKLNTIIPLHALKKVVTEAVQNESAT
jgi:hypothetical protein